MTAAPNTPSTIIPTLRYRDAHAAIEWLSKTFGFTPQAVYNGPNNTVSHAQLTLGGGMIMLGSARDDANARTHTHPSEVGGINTSSRYIVVADHDIDHIYARVQASEYLGAKVARPIASTDYGSREFACADPEGHYWTIGTYNPWH